MYFYPVFTMQAKQQASFRQRPLNPVPSICERTCGASQGAALSIIFNRCPVYLVLAYIDGNVENIQCAGCHSVRSVLITACGLLCFLEGKKRRHSFRWNCCLSNSGGKSGCCF